MNVYCLEIGMAFCRVCYGSMKLLNVLSKHKIVITSRVGYAKKGGNTFLLGTLAAFMQMNFRQGHV